MIRLLRYLSGHRKESVLAPLFKLMEALFDLMIPLLMADIINTGVAQKDTAYILWRCGLMVLLGLIGLACSITAQYFSAKASVESCERVRHGLFDKAQSLCYAQLDSIGASTLITRMTSDVQQVQNGLNLFLRLFLRSPFVVFGAMVMAFLIDARAAAAFAVVIPVLGGVVFAILLRSMPLHKGVQARVDKLTGVTRENLTGARVVRAFGREADEAARFTAENAALSRAQLRVGRVSALLNPLTYALINLAIVAVLKAGAVQVDTGALRMGDVVALVSYMNQVLVELVKLANLIIQLARAAACADRIERVMALPAGMAFGGNALDPAASDIAVAFDHVSLTYGGAGGESLTDISFTARRGQTIGVIGGTGSGKTSLVNLIPRFYDATGGTVSLFGQDVRAYSRDSLRRGIGVVAQKALLFSGTIRGNLLWGDPAADDDALWRALETAQAAEVVRGKSGGLDEPVAQGGRNFSGGQRQRLSIARALVGKPAILILDDASSALDYATDAALRRALRSLPADTTTFVVSQRAASLRHADQILVLDDGRLVGVGTHDTLLAGCAVYQDICASQLGSEEAGA